MVDAITQALFKYVPFSSLDGRTLEGALKHEAGRLLSDSSVIGAIHDGIENIEVRRALVAAAKSLLAMPFPIEDRIDQALDRVLAVPPSAF